MSAVVLYKLLAIFATVLLGHAAGRWRWLGEGDPARTLSTTVLYIFIPALLFRSMSRMDFGHMPWDTLLAFFAPLMGLVLAIYAWQRLRGHGQPAAQPAVRAIAAGFGNTVQVGVPVAAALFGEAGLSIHVAIISLHALTLLTVLTVLAELDLARERARQASAPSSLAATLATTVRNTVIHPVVLPVLAGLVWNLTGLSLHPVLDETLQLLGSAVVPLCLLMMGLSLDRRGLRERWGGALSICVLKLLALPALVLVVGRWGFGLSGMPLAVIVMAAALPPGSNAMLFSQRYRTAEGEVVAATVLSTLAFVATAPLWLALLGLVGGWSGAAGR